MQVEACALSLASVRMEQAIIESQLVQLADHTTQQMMSEVLALRRRVQQVGLDVPLLVSRTCCTLNAMVQAQVYMGQCHCQMTG